MKIDSSTTAVWLFARGSQTVRISATREDDGFALGIAGPGRQRTRRVFDAIQPLLDYEGVCQRRLTAKGFTLISFVRERRAGSDRRRMRRAPADRRTT